MSYLDELKKKRKSSSSTESSVITSAEDSSTSGESYLEQLKKKRKAEQDEYYAAMEKQNTPDWSTYDIDAARADLEQKQATYNKFSTNVNSWMVKVNDSKLKLMDIERQLNVSYGLTRQRRKELENEANSLRSTIAAGEEYISSIDLSTPKSNIDNLTKEINSAQAWRDQKARADETNRLYEEIIASPDYEEIMQKHEDDSFYKGSLGELLKKTYGAIFNPQNAGNRITAANATTEYDPETMTSYNSGAKNKILPKIMNEKEKLVYNAYYYRGEYDKAEEYYKSIEGDLEERARSVAKKNAAQFAKDKPFWSSAQSVGHSVFGTPTEAAVDLIKYGIDAVKDPTTAKLDRNDMADTVNITRQTVSEDMTPVGRFFYNTTMSGLDSLLAGLSFGNAAGVTLALSAGASAYNEGLDRGMSGEEAMAYGIASGLFEGIFESISLGNLKALKEVSPKTLKDVAVNIAKSMGVNASEETFTEIANIAYDTIFNGEYSKYQAMLDAGMSKGEALGQFVRQVLEAGASGALMGFGFGGVGSAIGYVNNKGADTVADIQNRMRQSASENQMYISFQNKVKDSKASTALTDIVKGREVKDGDLQKVIGNETARSILNETLGTDIKVENSLDEERDIISKAFESSEGKTPAETKIDRNRVVKSLEVNLPSEKAESFATIIADIGNGNEVSDKQIDSVLKNKFARNALNKYLERTVEDKFTESSKASDVRAVMAEGNYSRQGQAVLFGSTLGMSGNAIKGLSAVVANSRDADVASIARAYNVVYKAAKSGKALADVSGVEALSPTQKLIAYEYGVMDGLVEQSESKKKATEEAEDTEESITKETNEEVEISRESEVDEGAIVAKGGETIVPVKENTKEQTRIIDMGKKLGVEVAFGKITKNGKNIDGLFDGKVLYINPKTTSGNAAYILFKHEFTHFLEKSTKYINFAKEVTESKAFSEWLKKKGFKNSTEYYSQIIEDYKQIGKDLEDGGAQKEAVANFCAEMLYAKDDSMQRFVDTLSADHKRTFGELIRDFIEWIKKKLGKVDEIAMLEKKYAEVFQSKRFDAVNREQIADTGKMVEDDTQLSYTPSERDTAYLDAVNRGDMETAQRMVDEAAKEAGYDSELLHHGTNKFGFTEIDVTQSDDGISFFATDKFDTASSYIPYYEDSDAYDKIREIGKKEGKKRKVLTSNSSIEEFLDYLKEVYPDWYSDSHIITEAERHKYAEWDVTDAVRHAKELLRYSLPENVEALANLVIDSEGDKSKWGDLAKAYKEFKDIPDITYRGNYFSEASHVWYSLQDNIRLLNLHLTHELAMVRNMPESKESLLYSYEQLTGGENVGIYGLYAKTEGQLVIRGRASNWNNIPLGDITAKFNEWWVNEKGHEPAENGYYTRGNTRNIAEFAKYTGYRSVCFVDIYDSGAYGGGHGDISTIYAFFYPNEDVKSADPVTYDDDGNVIPLSERFNSENDDIRYSYTPASEEAREHKQMALDEFGTTTDYDIAGFVLDDGRMIKLGVKGIGVNHNKIEQIYDDKKGSDAVNSFIQEGNVRIKASSPGIEISADAPVTVSQLNTLSRFMSSSLRGRGYFYLDITDADGNEIGTKTYYDDSTVEDIKYDIKKYYRDGTIPTDSYYSYTPDKEATSTRTVSVEKIEELINAGEREIHGYKINHIYKGVPDKHLPAYTLTNPDGLASDYHGTWNVDVNRTIAEHIVEDIAKRVKRGLHTTSRKDNVNINYRDTSSVSTRSLLANMMDTVAESEREKNLLAKYKGYLERIDNNKAEIARLKEERKAASKAKKNVFTSKIQALEKDISDTERRLSNLEAMDTIKRLVEKERQAMRDEAHLAGQMAQGRKDARTIRRAREESKKLRESRDKSVESRHKTAIKEKISNTVKELDTLLRKGTKEKNIHYGLQAAVASALDVIDINQEKLDRYYARLAEIDKQIAELIAGGQTITKRYHELITERVDLQRNKDTFNQKLEKMRDAYQDIQTGEKAKDVAPYYKEEAKFIQGVVEETMKKVKDVAYEDMNLEQLEQVYKMYKIILTTVQNANKVFKGEKLADLVEDAGKIEHDLGDIKKLKEERWIGAEGAREYIWNELTPYYAFNRIGSETLMEYYWDLVRGQDTYARDVTEAKNFAQAVRKKYGYKNWDIDKTYTIKDKNGKDFSLSLKHMMSIYAYSKREQAKDHMEKGGFFFNDKETFRKDKKGLLHFIRSNETGYKVDEGVMTAILELMAEIDENTIAYVDEMQEYLTKMGEKGNEVSRKMWGIDIFKEKFYFPLKSKEDFIYQTNTPAETSSLKNDGMTKETKPHASNPIVLEAFDSVWDQHVEKMSKYHAFVIPIDNLNKVINYGTWADGDSKSITTMIRERYSSAAVDYLNTFIKDLNGAKAQRSMGWTFVTNLVTKFKKTAVAASMSVVVQQPTAILRSLSEIDAKYFAKLPKAMGLNAKWELIQKHAPVAIIKDIGGYDAGGGRSVIDWMGDDTKTGLDKAMSKIDDLTMYGAALGDRLGWGAIWTAVENEIADTTSLERGSEEFYEAVGKRFTEVIVKTQVYDSTLSRSGFMRGKDGLVKMAMAFKGEPTLSINMIMDAILQATRGKTSKKQMVRTIAAVYASVIAAALAKSLIYALRDDDEDESYLEKYGQAFGGTVAEWFPLTMPLTMLPIFSDVWSVLEGYTLERTDMSLIVDLYNAFTSLDSENKTTYRKIEDLAGAMGGLVGIPAKNILRSFREGYNVFENIFDGVDFGDIGKAFAEGVTGNEATKSESLYNAVMNNDTARINIYRDDYKDESTYTSALKRSLRENDPRVVKSVERALLGDYTLYNNSKRVISSTSKYGVKLVNEAFADERDYVLEKLSEARKARKNGDMKEYNKIIDQLVARGYSKAFILKKLK